MHVIRLLLDPVALFLLAVGAGYLAHIGIQRLSER
jgi:hypothetical protein